MRPKHLVTILVLLALAVPASPAHAGGIVSICDEAHLREMLAGGGTVTFGCSGTIILTAEITIAANTTIDGGGQAVTISGNYEVRVFTVNSGVTVNLNRLTIANGLLPRYGSGGGIINRGTLTVGNSTFFRNSAGFGGGGGIANEGGTVAVSHSTFSGNSAIYGRGGGIANYSGTLAVSHSIFSGNITYEGGGGGIANYGGTLTVSNSTFSGNNAYLGGGGGGIDNEGGALVVSHSTFSGNSGSGGGGIVHGGIRRRR